MGNVAVCLENRNAFLHLKKAICIELNNEDNLYVNKHERLNTIKLILHYNEMQNQFYSIYVLHTDRFFHSARVSNHLIPLHLGREQV